MKISKYILILAIVIGYCRYSLAQSSESVSARTVLSIVTAPCFDNPNKNNLPRIYVNKGDTCFLLETYFDSTGLSWFKLQVNDTDTLWSLTKYWYFSDLDFSDVEETSLNPQIVDTDRKRRLLILRQNPEWPHRIKKAVRDGTICLNMTPKQVNASWGDYLQESSAFALGVGEYLIWFFKDSNNIITAVTFLDNKVIGWSKN